MPLGFFFVLGFFALAFAFPTRLYALIFWLPGIGSFFVEALIRRDFPVVQSVNLIVATFALLLNLIVDFSYAYLDPRIRYR